ncbi:hypothetical protein BT69DRAFT_1343948 [Atractiella rhizophila]|nr:hypothetical protein BT69DRAFT_1343948 [Atractiella rhizophila]
MSEVWFNLGILYDACREEIGAIDAYERARELEPELNKEEIERRLMKIKKNVEEGRTTQESELEVRRNPPLILVHFNRARHLTSTTTKLSSANPTHVFAAPEVQLTSPSASGTPSVSASTTFATQSKKSEGWIPTCFPSPTSSSRPTTGGGMENGFKPQNGSPWFHSHLHFHSQSQSNSDASNQAHPPRPVAVTMNQSNLLMPPEDIGGEEENGSSASMSNGGRRKQKEAGSARKECPKPTPAKQRKKKSPEASTPVPQSSVHPSPKELQEKEESTMQMEVQVPSRQVNEEYDEEDAAICKIVTSPSHSHLHSSIPPTTTTATSVPASAEGIDGGKDEQMEEEENNELSESPSVELPPRPPFDRYTGQGGRSVTTPRSGSPPAERFKRKRSESNRQDGDSPHGKKRKLKEANGTVESLPAPISPPRIQSPVPPLATIPDIPQ